MLETIEQCQDPVLAESKVPEVPQPGTPSQDEIALTDQIVQLWVVHRDYQTSIKHQTQEFRSLRGELGKHLAEMKQMLAKPGRNGQWSSFLKEHEIPRAMADRLVQKYQRSLNPNGNRLSESISELTEDEIRELFAKIFPKLRRVLRTPTSFYRFIDLMTSSCEKVDRRLTDEGILVIKPLAQPESAAQQDPTVEHSFERTAIESQMASAQDVAELGEDLM